VNDTVRIIIGYAQSSAKLTQIIAGNGRLVRVGVNVGLSQGSAETGVDFAVAQNPRTAVGMNADSTKLYFCTVDGRLASSVGMSFDEIGAFLVSINVTNAFNFDGGGSTTMVVRGQVVNTPSDPGGERAVGNSLQVISIAATGSLAWLNIVEDRADVYPGSTFQFHAEGRDQFFSPLALPSGVAWNADANIGTIDAAGKFTSNNVIDSGWVRVRYNSITDSARVVVHTTTGVGGTIGMPYEYELGQNYPNPFNPSTRLMFSLASANRVTLRLYDVLGRTVAMLIDGVREAGRYECEWNATGAPSGVYFYELHAGNFTAVKRLVLQK
jgi:Phosphodiester glycosidase/Secretion system C-terminal sorting domain